MCTWVVSLSPTILSPAVKETGGRTGTRGTSPGKKGGESILDPVQGLEEKRESPLFLRKPEEISVSISAKVHNFTGRDPLTVLRLELNFTVEESVRSPPSLASVLTSHKRPQTAPGEVWTTHLGRPRGTRGDSTGRGGVVTATEWTSDEECPPGGSEEDVGVKDRQVRITLGSGRTSARVGSGEFCRGPTEVNRGRPSPFTTTSANQTVSSVAPAE